MKNIKVQPWTKEDLVTFTRTSQNIIKTSHNYLYNLIRPGKYLMWDSIQHIDPIHFT